MLKTLYKSQRCATLTHPNETFFETENVTSLSEEEKLSCDGIVSEDECLRALKEFKNCKSPGKDGLSESFAIGKDSSIHLIAKKYPYLIT